MDILFLTQTFPRFAGDIAGPFIEELARALVRRGDRVTVLAPHAAGVPAAWQSGGVEVRTFRYAPESAEVLGYGRSLEADLRVRGGAALAAPLYALAARRGLRALLAERRWDLVHAHWIVPNGVVAASVAGTGWRRRDDLADRKRRDEAPARSRRDGVGEGGDRSRLDTAVGRSRLDGDRVDGRNGQGGRGRPPLAIGLHGSDVFLAERPGVRRLAGWALGRTALLTGCSPELVERVGALGFPAERSRVIPYGVDVQRFAPASPGSAAAAATAGAAAATAATAVAGPAAALAVPGALGVERGEGWRQRLGIPENAAVLLSVGRMAAKKGFGVLAGVLPELLARHPDLHVVLAGGGDLLGELAAATAEWRERVHLPGPVLQDALPDLYRAADVFVLPAVHDAKGNVDGLPNVILEAMASGLPVVASGISGIPLAVVDGVTGVLLAEKDGAALAAALDGLLANRALARQMGAAGRARAVAELTWDAVAARHREAYVEVVETAAAGG